MRAKFYASTVCYLECEEKILFLKFHKKWGKRYAPPGGKVDENETPSECVIREFKEETGVTLKNPKLKGISYWKDHTEGIIFVYVANEYEGSITESVEGRLEWIRKADVLSLEQFEMNKKFTKYVFEDGMFEGKFILDDDTNVKEYSIIKI
ncbi:MAG: NUDIX domain-containing protein [Clostridia bacterium]|nr:NUDIX domain-containing protein [Clostridia bacterium]